MQTLTVGTTSSSRAMAPPLKGVPLGPALEQQQEEGMAAAAAVAVALPADMSPGGAM